MLKTRKLLVSILENVGWGFVGPAVLCGMYFISNILLSQNLAFGVLITAVVSALFTAIVVMGTGYNVGTRALAYTAGLVTWMIVALYSEAYTSISVSRTTLLVASVVYGAILINRFIPVQGKQNE